MVNPDGVVIGNYRTNLSGNDVNRRWDFPNKLLHPEVVAIKKKMTEDKREVRMFLDLHAHSRKYISPLTQNELPILRLPPRQKLAQTLPLRMLPPKPRHQLLIKLLFPRPLQTLHGPSCRPILTRHPQMLHILDVVFREI